MRGKDLLDKMELVNPGYVEAADAKGKKKNRSGMRWAAAAACLCIVIAAATAGFQLFSEDMSAGPDAAAIPFGLVYSEGITGLKENNTLEGENAAEGNGSIEDNGYTEGPWEPWAAYYNEATTALDAARLYIPGYFTEELSESEIEAVEPGMRMEWMKYSGYAGFDGEGNLTEVCLSVPISVSHSNISVMISESGIPRDYVLEDEPVVSVCEKVEYKVYQWELGNGNILLAADAQINGYFFAFTLNTTAQFLEQAKADFDRVLECFAYYADGKPDLSSITAEAIPEWFDRTLTYSEALKEPDYGQYMLQNIPEGYTEESIRRYRNQNYDYLSGLWSKGYHDISWKVSPFTEADEARVTDADTAENYDLSLYPIPRAASVPEELREIVDNPIFKIEELTLDVVYARSCLSEEAGEENGWKINFSVKYGDILVQIRTEGVTPEWIYDQLLQIK